jgi:hypothetical protein
MAESSTGSKNVSRNENHAGSSLLADTIVGGRLKRRRAIRAGFATSDEDADGGPFRWNDGRWESLSSPDRCPILARRLKSRQPTLLSASLRRVEAAPLEAQAPSRSSRAGMLTAHGLGRRNGRLPTYMSVSVTGFFSAHRAEHGVRWGGRISRCGSGDRASFPALISTQKDCRHNCRLATHMSAGLFFLLFSGQLAWIVTVRSIS